MDLRLVFSTPKKKKKSKGLITTIKSNKKTKTQNCFECFKYFEKEEKLKQEKKFCSESCYFKYLNKKQKQENLYIKRIDRIIQADVKDKKPKVIDLSSNFEIEYI